MPDTENWLKVAKLEIEANLDGRRVHAPDIETATEMAVNTYRTVLESRGYTVNLQAISEYGYQQSRVAVVEWDPDATIAEIDDLLDEDENEDEA